MTRLFTDMEIWVEVRRRVLTGELSKRTACRRFPSSRGPVFPDLRPARRGNNSPPPFLRNVLSTHQSKSVHHLHGETSPMLHRSFFWASACTLQTYSPAIQPADTFHWNDRQHPDAASRPRTEVAATCSQESAGGAIANAQLREPA